MIDLPNGIHKGLPHDAYHKREVGMVSRGALELLERSPAHYRAWVDGEVAEDSSPSMDFGIAFHCATLEPAEFEKTYCAEPDFGDCRYKPAKEARDRWREEHAGYKHLTAGAMEKIRRMSESIRKHPLAGKMLTGGESELTIRWTDEETGLPCKARADFYSKGRALLADIKTSMDASQEAISRDVFRYKWHWQHALYRAGFAAIGKEVKHFIFVVVEKEPPYAVATYTLDEKAISVGYRETRTLMRLLRDCKFHDMWPAYPVAIRTIDTPPWIES